LSQDLKNVVIYADGACIGNPGPGGYGVVLLYGEHRRELSGGFRRTTNNRMEILAVIVGLRALKQTCSVTVHSDSEYVVNSMSRGWARRWQENGWMRTKKERAVNPDLWDELLELCDKHEVKFVWVKGHAGNRENERCDQLAQRAAQRKDLPPDEGYERGKGMSPKRARLSRGPED
jgi:ribonuclease HI